MKIKIIKRFLIFVLSILLITEGLYLIVLPAAVNYMFLQGAPKTALKQITGLDLSFGQAKIKTYPTLALKLFTDDILLKDSQNNGVLKAKDFEVSLWLPSLLWKKLTLKSVTADDFALVFSRHEDKKIYLGNYALKFNIDPKQDIDLDIDRLIVSNASVTFDDKFIKQKNNLKIASADFLYKKDKKLKLVLKSGIFVNGKKKTDINADIFARLPFDKSLKKSDTHFFAQINDFDLADYSGYLSYLFNRDVKSASGVIDTVVKNNGENFIASVYVKNFDVKMPEPLDSVRSGSDIHLVADLGFKAKDLIVQKASIHADDWALNLAGRIKNYTSSKPGLDLKADINDADVHSMYWLVPTFKEDVTFVMRKFKKYGAWGKASGSLSIKGAAQKPEVFGELNVKDVYIVKNNPLVPHCKVYAKFLGDKVYVKTRVFAGYGEYVDIEGTAVMQLYGAGDFSIVSSKNVDLGTAEYMLVPIHEVVGFDIGPVPYMDIKGKGNINLKTKGTILDGEAYGQFNFRNTTASLQGLNTILEKAEGVLDFDGKDMHFYTKQAFVKNQPIKVDGKANLNGNIDFNVTSPSIELADLFNILKTSSILAEQKVMVEPVQKVGGKVKTAIKIKGIVKDFGEILKKNTLDFSGSLRLTDSTGELKYLPVPAKNLKGIINFDNDGWSADLNGLVGTSKITIKGICSKGATDLKIDAPSLKTDELIKAFVQSQNGRFPDLPETNSVMSFFAHYKNDSNEVDLSKVNAKGEFKPLGASAEDKDFVISSGSFNIARGDLTVKNFKAKLFNSQISADGKISGFYSKNYRINGNLNLSDFDISAFNSIKKMPLLPLYLKNLLNAYDNYQGTADANIKCSDNDLKGKINLKNIKFNHSFFKTPVSIDRGDILLNGTKITLHSVIAQIDNTPVFLNMSVRDLDKTMKLAGYFTTKLTDRFVNKYINTFLTYPVKPRGDITITTDISGNINNLRLKPNIKLAQGADIYYMGANLGDENEQREIKADINIKDGEVFNINDFVYRRYMTSQNDSIYPLPVFKASGVVRRSSKGFYADNLNVETLNNANVKLFNILFKKSVLKNGMFNCKLNIKGSIDSPVILGFVDMHNLDMPLYDTVIKSASAKFQGKSLYVKVDGDSMGSDFTLNMVGGNRLSRPFIIDKLELKSKHINLDTFIDSLTGIPTPDTAVRLVDTGTNSGSSMSGIIPSFNISDFQIKHGSMKADEVVIRDLSANNYTSDFSLAEDMVLKVDKLSFDVTTGKMMGTATYDFSNGKIKTNVSAFNVDSNKVASSLFGFNDQIFGTANGNISVTTHGAGEEERIRNMFGYVYFEVANGKMPKLGSVEYLLKAGNILKSGITGANLNNFIDLIAPIKTGYFDSIKGSFTLKNGVAQNIEVYSKGDNLNLYINGEFDVLQNYANMRVFGRLTKRAANILGPIGNLSFNSLLNAIPGIKLGRNEKSSFIKDLNKIPGVELDDQQYRVFTVKIDGKINDNKFVKNFRWME